MLSLRVHPAVFCPGSAVSDNESGVGITFVSRHLMRLSLSGCCKSILLVAGFRNMVRMCPGVVVFGVGELAGRVVARLPHLEASLPLLPPELFLLSCAVLSVVGAVDCAVWPPRPSPLFPIIVDSVTGLRVCEVWSTVHHVR